MNVFRVDFDELYRRHLRRHSQFGLNVLHFIAVLGVYFALYGIAFALPGANWIVGGLLGAYCLVLAANVPIRVFLVNSAVVGGLLAGFLQVRELWTIPVWAFVVIMLASHRFQLFQHKVYNRELDMTEFNSKYRKGPTLFVLLAIYELPILLNYLVFDGARPLVESDELNVGQQQ